MTAPTSPPSSWHELLTLAIASPGLVHEAYQRFHRYSLHNQLLVLQQCLERGLAPGALNTYLGWRHLGRTVRKGETALHLYVPIVARRDDEEVIAGFTVRRRWFVLSQTTGTPYTPVDSPTWSETQALRTLGVEMVEFAHGDGNVQGYAQAPNKVAISPVAALPHKTLFHELGHLLLGHLDKEAPLAHVREAEAEAVALLCCEALGLTGSEYARGYLQAWLRDTPLSDESARRAMQAAQRILTAGAQDTAHDLPE